MRKFLQFYTNLRFKHKLFLSYIAVTIIPILVLGLFSFYSARASLESKSRYAIQVELDQMARGLNYKVSRYDSVIDYILYNTRFQSLFCKDQGEYFNVVMELLNYISPLFANVTYLNNDIQSLLFYNDNNVPEYDKFVVSYNRVKDTSWYKAANEKTEWYYNGKDFFCVRKLIGFNNNQTSGVLYLKLNYNKFFELAAENKNQEYGLIISDGKHDVLFSQDTYKDKKMIVEQSMLETYQDGVSNINGIDYMVLKRSIPGTTWTIYYYTPSSMITVDAREILGASLLIVAFCMVITVLLILLFSKTFVKRIHSLIRQMKKVQEGNLQIKVSSSSQDEIGELTNSFGIMLQRVNDLIDEVYQSKLIQRDAEFQALQAQINPHFLYNVLSLINWKAKMIRANDISHITNTVSKFYRTTLNNGENIISIRDEIINTESYVEIQSILHDYSFDVFYSVDEDIYKFDMIKLILQPIVENAIMHGIDKKRDGRGRLEIKGFLHPETIELSVFDNGPGFGTDFSEQILTKQSKGYGLKNVQERIKLFFGNEYGISITSTIDDGTSVKVTLPRFMKETG